ncbi:hypothetical protein QYM36_000372 [Artemia franciscana]|uniref:Uncharacterized protein n=1 Tax=Artemia franciscana TaxID=6661 RepID=A0AA88I7Z1_ARTSF|nr:hypothetical protein QYM36_000372 [Artemia franciscana]
MYIHSIKKKVEDEYSTIIKKLCSRPISLAKAVNFVLCPDNAFDLEYLPSKDQNPSNPQHVPPDEALKELLGVEAETGRIEPTTMTVRLKEEAHVTSGWKRSQIGYDNKPIHLISIYAAVDPEYACERWDGKQKEHIEVKRPHCVKEYNRFMGGVYLADMLIELYKLDFKSQNK